MAALNESLMKATIKSEIEANLNIQDPSKADDFAAAMAAALYEILKNQVQTIDTNGDTGTVV